MATLQDHFTRRDYERLPEGFPAQLVEGMLVKEPSPTYGHQSIQMRLIQRLLPLVSEGLLIAAPADVAVDDLNVYRPDIVVLREPPPRRDLHYVGTPLLAIEILTPGTAERDRRVKARRLLEIGVEEVRLVDPDGGTIEYRRSEGTRSVRGSRAVSSRAVPSFEVAPETLFAA